jgi:hypothetical protein
MMHPLAFLSLGMSMARLGMDAQIVVAERLSRLSRGDAGAGLEAMRMMTEKALALGEVNSRLVSAAAAGRLHESAPEIVALYARKVRANRRRLARGKAK